MKRLWALIVALALLAGCAPHGGEDGKTHILCTTYPVYLFTTAVTQGVDQVEVELLVNQQTACLHDYTLTVEDMRAIEGADVIVMNGAGLEEFMADALAQSDAAVIDCSEGIDLLPALGHHHHEGEDESEHEADPHYWMDPANAQVMLDNIAQGLGQALPGDSEAVQNNCRAAAGQLSEAAERWQGSSLYGSLITFHDGFQYFSQAFGLELLRSIEEEEGAEASAKELEELVFLVRDGNIPAIFVEKNGSRRSADVISREAGCKVYELDMIMSGNGQGIEPYIQAMEQNLGAVLEALG